MTQKQFVELVEGDEAKQLLGDREIIHLTNRVNNLSSSEMVGHLRHQIAQRIYSLFPNTNAAHSIIQKIDPAFGPIEHMKILRENGQIAIAQVDDKIAGMVGFEHRGIDSETGKSVYEIRRLAVKEEYEGRQIGTQLHNTVCKRITSLDPNAVILVEAQHPSMKSICEKMGYHPCEPRNGIRMQCGEDNIDAKLDWFEQSGGQYFVYDLAPK